MQNLDFVLQLVLSVDTIDFDLRDVVRCMFGLTTYELMVLLSTRYRPRDADDEYRVRRALTILDDMELMQGYSRGSRPAQWQSARRRVLEDGFVS
jgi:hypothetical protein